MLLEGRLQLTSGYQSASCQRQGRDESWWVDDKGRGEQLCGTQSDLLVLVTALANCLVAGFGG